MNPDQVREHWWQQMIVRYDPDLRAYLRSTHADATAVDDMVWDVWASAANQEQVVSTPLDLWPMLRQIASEVGRNYVRRSRHEFPLRDIDQREAHAGSDPVSQREEWMRRAPMLAWQAEALSALSARQRYVVDLRYRYRLPDDVISEALGISESTLRVHAKRGLKKLREYAETHPPPRDGVKKSATNSHAVGVGRFVCDANAAMSGSPNARIFSAAK